MDLLDNWKENLLDHRTGDVVLEIPQIAISRHIITLPLKGELTRLFAMQPAAN
jgi:hypothetical protein